MNKYKNLDGLRGLAALVVVFFHFTIAFAPFLIGFNATTRHTGLDHALSTTPLFLPWAGSFSVLVFFVLSGFVLSLGYFHKKTLETLISSATRRYFRLAIPAAASVLLAYIAMRIFGINAHQEVAAYTESSWLASAWPEAPNLWSALYQGFYSVFFTNFYPYNSNLWTMYIELYGSFYVFLFLALFGKIKRRWIFYIAFGAIYLKTYFLAFIIGMALCDIWTNTSIMQKYVTGKVATALLTTGLILGSWHCTGNIYGDMFNRVHLPLFTGAELEILIRTLAASFILVSTLRLKFLTRFFELKPLQYLGKVSFALYLVHFIFICSISSIMFNALLPHIGYKLTVMAVFSLSLPAIFLISHLFTKFVDAPAINISRSIADWILSKPKKEEPVVKDAVPVRPLPLLAPDVAES